MWMDIIYKVYGNSALALIIDTIFLILSIAIIIINFYFLRDGHGCQFRTLITMIFDPHLLFDHIGSDAWIWSSPELRKTKRYCCCSIVKRGCRFVTLAIVIPTQRNKSRRVREDSVVYVTRYLSSSLSTTTATSSCACFALCLCVHGYVCVFVFMDSSSVIEVQEE